MSSYKNLWLFFRSSTFSLVFCLKNKVISRECQPHPHPQSYLISALTCFTKSPAKGMLKMLSSHKPSSCQLKILPSRKSLFCRSTAMAPGYRAFTWNNALSRKVQALYLPHPEEELIQLPPLSPPHPGHVLCNLSKNTLFLHHVNH